MVNDRLNCENDLERVFTQGFEGKTFQGMAGDGLSGKSPFSVPLDEMTEEQRRILYANLFAEFYKNKTHYNDES